MSSSHLSSPLPAPSASVITIERAPRRRAWRDLVSSGISSLATHVALLLILAVTVDRPRLTATVASLVATTDEVDRENQPVETALEESSAADASLLTTELVAAPSAEIALPAPDVATLPSVEVALESPGFESLAAADMLQAIGSSGLQALSGRSDASRAALVRQRGGSPQSEAAVGSGLAWLAAHQNPDGSWNFDHRYTSCQGRCRGAGDLNSAPLGATGLALLPFLGAGQTHREGKYREQVSAGLRFLVSRMQTTPEGSSLIDAGTMYSHGIGTLALCEAYAMTQDPALGPAAQGAVQFIVQAQDPVGGGWRYAPRMAGDTSVVGWQLMALKSADLGYLQVPPRTVAGAAHFLSQVQSDGGAAYGYQEPGNAPGTTAVGLLCRMYLGWNREEPALRRGVARLVDEGPSATNIYFNYYATQVVHHYDDDQLWKAWNEQMRELLLRLQDQQGHETGSWHFGGGHDLALGGRLYLTAMAVMTLEVYYRYLPLYKREVLMDDFERELGEKNLRGREGEQPPSEP